MDKDNGSSSNTIKVGDVDITININHHGGSEHEQSGGGFNAPPPAPAYTPPVRQRKSRKNIISIAVICFCVISIPIMFWNYSYITPSTHGRRALPPGLANETGYYTDEAAWIEDENTLLKGLEEFYETTGVHPYIYITKTFNGSTAPLDQQLKDHANNFYRELFSDEAHLLLVLFVSGDRYTDSFAFGTQAAGVIDAEAENILRDSLNYNFSFKSNTNSEALSETFDDAADRIMSVTLSPWVVFFTFGPTAAIVAYFYIRRRKKEREAKEAISTEEMLKIPLEKFGDPEVEELARKYDNKT